MVFMRFNPLRRGGGIQTPATSTPVPTETEGFNPLRRGGGIQTQEGICLAINDGGVSIP